MEVKLDAIRVSALLLGAEDEETGQEGILDCGKSCMTVDLS